MSEGSADTHDGKPRGRRIPALEPVGLREEFLWWSVSSLSRTVMRTAFRVRKSDIPVLPDEPVILAPNHASFLDPLLVGGFLERRVTFMMAAKYYDARWIGSIYRAARCIPLDDSGTNRGALREAAEVLEQGQTLVIFPEGSISLDGNLQELQPGCAWIANRTGAPVYPVHLSGTYEALPKHARWPRFARLGMSFGDPLRVSDFGAGKQGMEAFTRELRRSIVDLGEASRPPW